MELSLRYADLRVRLRNYLSTRERLLSGFRLLRCALLQGPWRPWLIRRYQAQRPSAPPAAPIETLFPEVEPDRAARLLRQDAYAPGFRVPERVVDEILACARAAGGKRIDEPHLEWEPVRRLACDAAIVEVARRYLEAEPILLKSQLYWTIPPGTVQGNINAAAEGGRFHYDLADIKALTVFIYLTDVDPDCGPHIVIRGTQARRTPAQILRRFIEDDCARRKYGDRIQMILGKRGTGWFEDITCYHKQAPAERVRCMLYLTYSLHRRPEATQAGRAA